MYKPCQCGQSMEMKLRMVIYSNKVEIDDVPIYYCTQCKCSEVMPGVKPELTDLIGKLGSNPEKQAISFSEVNELAYLMKLAMDPGCADVSIERMIEERVNQLLDLMLLAKSLHNDEWKEEVRNRLEQITRHFVTT